VEDYNFRILLTQNLLMISFKQIIFLIVFAFMSFEGRAQMNSSKDSICFTPDNFSNDTLYIKTQFMECGEWGGHLELSKIFSRLQFN